MDRFLREAYAELKKIHGLTDGFPIRPVAGETLGEVRLNTGYTEIRHTDVDLSTVIGPVKLNVPFLGAAMDTVSGPHLAQTFSDVGGAAVIYRPYSARYQLEMVDQALDYTPCLVKEPYRLTSDEPLREAAHIKKTLGFDTIPVVTRDGLFEGVLFNRNITFTQENANDPVSKWMKPVSDLQCVDDSESFASVRNRLLAERHFSVLPVIGQNKEFKGIYFRKDFRIANPALHGGKILVGIAISDQKYDIDDRLMPALEMGVGIVVIDSSHGDCRDVIEQTRRVAAIVKGRAALVVGNVVDIGSYYRLALAGADAVKVGIGGGSICSTSGVTGVGVPLFMAIRWLRFMYLRMKAAGKPHPIIIPDGGINDTGAFVVAMASGGEGCMVGKWLAAAEESLGAKKGGVKKGGKVPYRGMASDDAIAERASEGRYGEKSSAEGVTGTVICRGPLKTWFQRDLESIRKGYSHSNARNTEALHIFGDGKSEDCPIPFAGFTFAGMNQVATRVDSCA